MDSQGKGTVQRWAEATVLAVLSGVRAWVGDAFALGAAAEGEKGKKERAAAAAKQVIEIEKGVCTCRHYVCGMKGSHV